MCREATAIATSLPPSLSPSAPSCFFFFACFPLSPLVAAAGTSSFVQVSRPLYPAVLFSLTRVHRSEGGKQFVFLSRRVRCPNRLSPLTTLPVRPAAQRYPSSISVTQCVQYSPLILFAPRPRGALCFRSKVSAQIRIKERGCSSSERRACSFLVSGFSLSRAPYEAKKKRTKKKKLLGRTHASRN